MSEEAMDRGVLRITVLNGRPFAGYIELPAPGESDITAPDNREDPTPGTSAAEEASEEQPADDPPESLTREVAPGLLLAESANGHPIVIELVRPGPRFLEPLNALLEELELPGLTPEEEESLKRLPHESPPGPSELTDLAEPEQGRGPQE